MFLAPIAAIFFAGSAQAGLLVNSVDMSVAHSTFRVTDVNDFAGAQSAYELAFAGDPICAIPLATFNRVGAATTQCGGPKRNTVAAFSISGYNSGNTELEFGLDWGRGGYVSLAVDGAPAVVDKYNEDIWWGYNWRSSDVLSLNINATGSFDLLLLGFEGCCNGTNSARWRSNGGDWQVLSVNSVAAAAIPAPPVQWLLGLGLLGLVFQSRRRNAAVSGRQ